MLYVPARWNRLPPTKHRLHDHTAFAVCTDDAAPVEYASVLRIKTDGTPPRQVPECPASSRMR